MNEQEARILLSKSDWIRLFPGDNKISMDGDFTVEELEACIVLMKSGSTTIFEWNK